MSIKKWNMIFVYICAVFSIIAWSLILVSCDGLGLTSITKTPPETPTVEKEGVSVGESSKIVGETGKDVGSRAEKIDSHTTAIETKVPPGTRVTFQSEVDGIRTETKGLREDSAILSATEKKLKDIQSQLFDQQKNIEKYTAFAKESETARQKLQDKITELETSNAKMLRTMLSWIVVCCVVGIGVSLVIGFFFKTPAAFMVAAGCVATMGIAVAVTLYLQQIAWVALGLLGVGFIAAVVYVFLQIKRRDTAVKELIHTGEVAKTYMPAQAREKVFGNTVEPGVAHQIQSNTTMNLVQKIRSQAKEKRGYGLAPTPTKVNAPVVNTIANPTTKTILG